MTIIKLSDVGIDGRLHPTTVGVYVLTSDVGARPDWLAPWEVRAEWHDKVKKALKVEHDVNVEIYQIDVLTKDELREMVKKAEAELNRSQRKLDKLRKAAYEATYGIGEYV